MYSVETKHDGDPVLGCQEAVHCPGCQHGEEGAQEVSLETTLVTSK